MPTVAQMRTPNVAVAKYIIRTELGLDTYRKQDEIIEAVFTPGVRYVYVKSCTSSGKTTAAAAIVAAWLLSCPGRIAITTAPTGRQVKELLWKEIRKLASNVVKSGRVIGGELSPSTPVWRIEEGWMAIGFSTDDPVNMQGWHSENGTLIVLDEAPGVPQPIWEALEATMTGDNDRMLVLGNPVDPSGPFYDGFRQTNVVRVHISAFDVIEHGGGRNGLVTRESVEDKRIKWGEDSPLWKARVLGEFPDSSDQILVPLSWLEASKEKWQGAKLPDGPREAGLDIARMGADKTVLAVAAFGKECIYIPTLDKRVKQDTMETSGLAMLAINKHGIKKMRVDGDGLGAGVFDRLNEQKCPVTEMRGGMTANEPIRFFNARSEWLWGVREALDPNIEGPRLLLPPDDELIFQASSLRYSLDSKGRIKVESKDEWNKRTSRSSTDELDAVAMALARGAGITKPRFTFL